MEFPHVGHRCTYEHCNWLDFLPLQCRCGDIFCSEHLNRHVLSCLESKNLPESDLKKIETLYLCSESGCKVKSIVPLLCNKCGKHFCVRHRHLAECKEKSAEEIESEKEKYAAPLKRFNEAKSAIDTQIDKNLSAASKNPKKQATAIKVQLMRLKSKATGQKSIPQSDRVYFNVEYPDTVVKTKPIFVSAKWSLGKTIDAVVEECGLQNNNNKSAAKKLRLFKKSDDSIVCDNLSISVEMLISDEVLFNGQDLILSYVD